MKDKEMFSPETPLTSINMPHWSVVLDEIFHIPPSWISGRPPPRTVGELVALSGMNADKAWQRLRRLVIVAADIEMTCEELQQALAKKEPLLLIDVRQPEEFAICRIAGSLLLCEADQSELVMQLQEGKRAVTICHHGVRSFSAAMYFRERGFTVQSLAGGVDQWAKTIDPHMARY